MSSYCAFAPTHPTHAHYHEYEYGFPLFKDDELFERLILEINQAGLSWQTILNKRANFQKAYARFNVAKVAAFNESDINRLLADAGIIRNKLKVNAAIENAKRIVAIAQTHGRFYDWLLAHHPLPKMDWVKLFKKSFVFTGGEITGEFLMSIGFLPGAHSPECPVYQRLAQSATPPMWMAVAHTQPNFYHH